MGLGAARTLLARTALAQAAVLQATDPGAGRLERHARRLNALEDELWPAAESMRAEWAMHEAALVRSEGQSFSRRYRTSDETDGSGQVSPTQDAVFTFVMDGLWPPEDTRVWLGDYAAMLIEETETGASPGEVRALQYEADRRAEERRDFWARLPFVGLELGHCKYSHERVLSTLRAMRAIALVEKHERDTGQYPESLSDVPEYAEEGIPMDEESGLPFGYRREGQSFVLWTAGPDGVDDGAPVMDPKPERYGDWPDYVYYPPYYYRRTDLDDRPDPATPADPAGSG